METGGGRHQTPLRPMFVVQHPVFGDTPIHTTCGNCGREIVTTVIKEIGGCAYLMCIIACCICWPCFWIPLVMDTCKDSVHMCPNCGAQLGDSKALS